MAVIDLKTEQFEDTINDNDIIIFDFWADWCEPCKQFAPTFADVSEKFPEIAFCKVNVEEEQELAGMFQVRSIPTLVFMREKVVVFSNPGAIPGSAFEEAIGQLLELDMDQVRQDLEAAQKNQGA